MSKTIWVPGIGNVDTFDDAIIPPGGHLVSPPPPPVSNTPPPSNVVPVSGGYITGAYTGSDGATHGTFVGGGGGSLPYTPVTPPVVVATDPRTLRQQEMNNNKVWANDPAVKQLEMKVWQIYVDTGRWDTPEQLDLHKQAEDLRKASNPTFTGTGPAGPLNQGQENGIFLPAVPADPAVGKIATYGLGALALLVLVGLFKG